MDKKDIIIDIKSRLRSDLWQAIEAHYIRKDYTESVRDAIFFTNDIIRDRSGIEDKDGTSLMEHVFLGKEPKLIVNKFETTTEKNIQTGIGFIYKGISLAIRSPISHSAIKYNINEADSILFFLNYLLNIIYNSKEKTRINDWLTFLQNQYNPNNDEEFAEKLIKEELHKNKKYDLLIQIYRERTTFKTNTINAFACKLFDALSPSNQDEFLDIVNKDLLNAIDDENLKMFLHVFTPKLYPLIDELCKIKIEKMIYRSLKNGEMIYNENAYGYLNVYINDEGNLALWVSDKLEMFNNSDELKKLLIINSNTSQGRKEYIEEFAKNKFSEDVLSAYTTYATNEIDDFDVPF